MWMVRDKKLPRVLDVLEVLELRLSMLNAGVFVRPRYVSGY